MEKLTSRLYLYLLIILTIIGKIIANILKNQTLDLIIETIFLLLLGTWAINRGIKPLTKKMTAEEETKDYHKYTRHSKFWEAILGEKKAKKFTKKIVKSPLGPIFDIILIILGIIIIILTLDRIFKFLPWN